MKPKARGVKGTIRSWFYTTDNWYPNYEDDLVEVSLTKLVSSSSELQWRVCIWGADDFGMEKDFVTRIEAYDEFILLPETITQDYLYSRGFENA